MADDWGDTDGGDGWNDGGELEDSAMDNNEQMGDDVKNTFYQAEELQQDNPQEAIRLYCQFLDSTMTSSREHKSERLESLRSLVKLQMTAGRVEEALGRWKELLNVYASTGFTDARDTIFKLLVHCKGKFGRAALVQLDKFYRMALAAVEPASWPVYPSTLATPPFVEPVTAASSPSSSSPAEPTDGVAGASAAGADSSLASSLASTSAPAPASVSASVSGSASASPSSSSPSSASASASPSPSPSSPGAAPLTADLARARAASFDMQDEKETLDDARAQLWFSIGVDFVDSVLLPNKSIPASQETLRGMQRSLRWQDQLTLFALEHTAFSLSGDSSGSDQVLQKSLAFAKDRAAVLQILDSCECAATLTLAIANVEFQAERWDVAFKLLSSCVKCFQKLNKLDHAVKALKQLVIVQMLSGRKCVFFDRPCAALEPREDMQPVAKVCRALDSGVFHVYKKVLKENEKALVNDPALAAYVPRLQLISPKSLVDTKDDSLPIMRKVDLQDAGKQECAVCLDEFGGKFPAPCRLFRCDAHFFHWKCVRPWIEKHSRCPVCNLYYGKSTGTMPEGKMDTTTNSKSLPGYTCPTVCLHFTFPGGVQGDNHPHPGQAYRTSNLTAFIPDNPDGQEILGLFKLAWERKQLFTLSPQDDIMPDGVPLIKSIQAGHDPTYLDRCREELTAKGVVL